MRQTLRGPASSRPEPVGPRKSEDFSHDVNTEQSSRSMHPDVSDLHSKSSSKEKDGVGRPQLWRVRRGGRKKV